MPAKKRVLGSDLKKIDRHVIQPHEYDEIPELTDEFFERADMMDTDVGTTKKDDPADVAETGFKAMMRGDGDVVAGLKNKIQSAVANVVPTPVLAKQHRKMAEPGTAKDRGAA